MSKIMISRCCKTLAVTILMTHAATVSAITIDEGPTSAPPGMGSEAVSGNPGEAGGLTIDYTGMDLTQTANLYFGIRNDSYVNGYSMDGGAISDGEIFRFLSMSPTTIVYTAETVIETYPGPTQYAQPLRMTLTFTGSGSIVYDATTVALSGPNGDVGALWHLAGDFSLSVLMEAQVVQPGDTNYGFWEPATELFNRLETAGVSGTGSSMDWGFYYEAASLDSDSDGIPDASDNCIDVANTGQEDTDGDGHGNICDGDFDDNCMTNFADLSEMKARFLTVDPLCDLDSSGGVVNFTDLSIMKGLFLLAPGPSAEGECN